MIPGSALNLKNTVLIPALLVSLASFTANCCAQSTSSRDHHVFHRPPAPVRSPHPVSGQSISAPRGNAKSGKAKAGSVTSQNPA